MINNRTFTAPVIQKTTQPTLVRHLLPTKEEVERFGDKDLFHFEWIKLSELVVDSENYQRELEEKRVNRIAGKMDQLLFGIPLINFRESDSTFYVVDGQHRIRALRVHRMRENHGKDVLVYCRVMYFATSEEEAYYYALFNATQQPLSHGQVFRARVHYKDEVALEIVDAVRAGGAELEYTGGRFHGPGNSHSIKATRAVESLRKLVGNEGVTETVSIIRAIYPDHDSALTYKMLGSFGMFLHQYRNHENYHRQILIDSFAQVSLNELMRKASEIAAKSGQVIGGNAQQPLVMAILFYYNRGRSKRRLPNPSPSPRVVGILRNEGSRVDSE